MADPLRATAGRAGFSCERHLPRSVWYSPARTARSFAARLAGRRRRPATFLLNSPTPASPPLMLCHRPFNRQHLRTVLRRQHATTKVLHLIRAFCYCTVWIVVLDAK